MIFVFEILIDVHICFGIFNWYLLCCVVWILVQISFAISGHHQTLRRREVPYPRSGVSQHHAPSQLPLCASRSYSLEDCRGCKSSMEHSSPGCSRSAHDTSIRSCHDRDKYCELNRLLSCFSDILFEYVLRLDLSSWTTCAIDGIPVIFCMAWVQFVTFRTRAWSGSVETPRQKFMLSFGRKLWSWPSLTQILWKIVRWVFHKHVVHCLQNFTLSIDFVVMVCFYQNSFTLIFCLLGFAFLVVVVVDFVFSVMGDHKNHAGDDDVQVQERPSKRPKSAQAVCTFVLGIVTVLQFTA